MAQLLPVAFALPLAFLFGGRLHRVGRLELRGIWLFFLAVAIQVVAFPFAFLPWTTGEDTAKGLWLVSYACLLVAAALNRRILGAQIVAAGMALNLAAILSNGGRMPATPEAMSAAGLEYAVRHNSVASSDPALPWLVDRFAAPEWVPWANVFSVGDAVIALGSIVLVFAATGARIPGVVGRRALPRSHARRPRLRRLRRRPAASPAQIAARAATGPDGRTEPARVATIPARSARHASASNEYARKRVEARAGPAEPPVSDDAAGARRAERRHRAGRRELWLAASVLAAAGVAVAVGSNRQRRRGHGSGRSR